MIKYSQQIKYIGGEIELSADNSTAIKSNLKEKYSLFSTGRTAIINILKTIKPKRKVLLPSYLCESIIQPFKLLGIDYDFFRIKKDLSIDHEFLINKIRETKCSAIYYINYFGFLNDLDIDLIKEVDSSIICIEDCTHSTFILNEVVGYRNRGDIVFGSLRKILPVSDGAYILKQNKINNFNAQSKETHFSKLKKYGKTLRSIYLRNGKPAELENIYLNLLSMAEDELNREIPNTLMTELSVSILEHLDLSKIYQRRRYNYNFLYKQFIEDKYISEIGYPLKSIDDMEMPYMLPFIVTNANRNKLRARLREYGIFTPIIWDEPTEVNQTDYLDSYDLSNCILCFPIDQRYIGDDMHYIVEKLKRIIQNGQ